MISMLNIDIGLIANLLVAFGTILLAIVSYKNVNIIKKQTKLIFSQSNYLRLQQTPFLKTADLKFNGNEIILRLTNIGNGIAKEIGVESGFYIVAPELGEPPNDKIKEKILKEKGISKKDWEATTKLFGREMWFKYKWNPHKELFKEEGQNKLLGIFPKEISKAYPKEYITYLKEEKNVSPILEIGKTGVFKCVPQMGIAVGEQYLLGEKWPKYSKRVSYDELLNLCKENGIEFLGFKFDLIYKDLAENIQMPEELMTCVVNIGSHKTIEEAVKENVHLDFFALGPHEIEKKIGGQFKDFYKLKTSPNNLESFDEE